jgi:hypothetical protein
MIRMLRSAALLTVMIFSSSNAQSVIKVLQFDKNTGIIDKGEDTGLRVGDVFDVNRYTGDFVYWIGRVEVVAVKPKVAGVKMLVQAENARIQADDVLELRQRDAAGPEKKNQAVSSSKKNESSQPGKIEPAALNEAASSSLRAKKVFFGLTSGLSQPLKNSSQSLGLNFSLLVRTSDNKTRVIDMTHAYTTSLGLRAYCTIPLSDRLAANLNYDYLPLNVKSAVEVDLLSYGMKASASVMKVSAALEGRIDRRVRLGLGAGLFLPQVTITGGRQSITVSERHFGFAASAAHLVPLGPAAWLRSIFEYNIFLDKGPAIHYATLQTGLSIGIGKN